VIFGSLVVMNAHDGATTSGELASTDPTTGAQDAGVQECGGQPNDLMLADLNENWGRKVLHTQPVFAGSRGSLNFSMKKNTVRIGRAMAVRSYRGLDNEELQPARL
jgi:hypothetical protein